MPNNIKLDGVEANIDDVLAELRKHGDVTFDAKPPAKKTFESDFHTVTVFKGGFGGARITSGGAGVTNPCSSYGIKHLIKALQMAYDYMDDSMKGED